MDERDGIVLRSDFHAVALVQYNRTGSMSYVRVISGVYREMQDIIDKHLDT
jgi:hypothetical protein